MLVVLAPLLNLLLDNINSFKRILRVQILAIHYPPNVAFTEFVDVAGGGPPAAGNGA